MQSSATLAVIMYVAIFAVASCSSDHAPATKATTKNVEPLWGENIDGLQIRLTFDKAKFEPMEDAPCRMDLQNTGKITAFVASGSGIVSDYEIEVTLPDGRKAPLTLWGQARQQNAGSGSSALSKLAPEKVVSESVKDLTRAYDMTLDGEYVITAHRGFRSPINITKWIDTKSNSVTIRIGH